MIEQGRSRMSKVLGVLTVLYGFFLVCLGKYGLGIIAIVGGALFWKMGFALAGVLAILAATVIESYYSVIGGWIIEYIRLSCTGGIAQIDSVESAGNAFGEFLKHPWRLFWFHVIFLTFSASMLWGGIKNGIERFSKILMPALFILLLLVILRSVTLPGAAAGIQFLLRPDFSKLSTDSVLVALGHSFYSLSMGMAINITYGSYQKSSENLFSSALWVIFTDTMAALLAGLAIFPAVFAMGFNPGQGPGLIFNVLPATFSRMPLGSLWAGLFFLMFGIAAMTSSAALMECSVTWLIDQFHFKRKAAIVISYLTIGLLGVLTCVSVGSWERIERVHSVVVSVMGEAFAKDSWMDFLDNLTGNWLISIVALLTSLFVGWVWGTQQSSVAIRMGSEQYADRNFLMWLCGLVKDKFYGANDRFTGFTPVTTWLLLTRFFAPVLIVIIFLKALGIL